MTSFVAMRLIKLVIKNDPLVTMLTVDSMESEVDLLDLNYMFAIQALDSRIGRVIAN